MLGKELAAFEGPGLRDVPQAALQEAAALAAVFSTGASLHSPEAWDKSTRARALRLRALVAEVREADEDGVMLADDPRLMIHQLAEEPVYDDWGPPRRRRGRVAK